MNFYWSIYESLEEEVLRLADTICFDDDQLKVYSIKIGNLIVRCAIEIESLAKELYCGLGGEPMVGNGKKHSGKYPRFDTECLGLLIKEWEIDRKKIQVVSSKMSFSKDNAFLTPLNDSNKYGHKGSPWKSAYQAFKHDRAQKIKTATVGNLLGALGALYILNLYHRDESFWYGVPIEGREEYQPHSRIFSPFICDVSNRLSLNNDKEFFTVGANVLFEEAIYLKKHTDDTMKQLRDFIYSYELDLQLQAKSSDELIEYIQAQSRNAEKLDASFFKNWGLNINHMLKNIHMGNISPEVYSRKEIVLNKGQQIYPERTWEDFLETQTAKKMIEDKMAILNQKLSSGQD